MDREKAVADMTRVLQASRAAADMPHYQAMEYRVRLYACIKRNAPQGTEYREQMEAIRDRSDDSPGLEIGDLLGVLTALCDDIEHDCLETFEERVHGEVFRDLLAQANSLASEKHHRAAMVIAGAALEQHVRAQCVKHGLSLEARTGEPKKFIVMIGELKNAEAFRESTRATLEGWAKVRNDAAHGLPGFEEPDTAHVPQSRASASSSRSIQLDLTCDRILRTLPPVAGIANATRL